ncbi:13080_t:CDS:1, partial [Ambispora gerdemannii]
YKLTKESELLPAPTVAKTSHEFLRNFIISHTSHLDLNEVSTYLSEFETKAESLLWWRANDIQYPTLARVAMDYLAVQATSVP